LIFTENASILSLNATKRCGGDAALGTADSIQCVPDPQLDSGGRGKTEIRMDAGRGRIKDSDRIIPICPHVQNCRKNE